MIFSKAPTVALLRSLPVWTRVSAVLGPDTQRHSAVVYEHINITSKCSKTDLVGSWCQQ